MARENSAKAIYAFSRARDNLCSLLACFDPSLRFALLCQDDMTLSLQLLYRNLPRKLQGVKSHGEN